MKNAISNSHISIAIQALQNLSNEEDINIFCTGLMIDLTTDLARFRTFRIISAIHSTQLPENVDYSVKGIARYRNEQLQINLQLIYTKENRLVWAEKFVGNLESIFQIEADMVQKIVTSLQQSVEFDLLAQIRNRSLKNLTAYENWLYGMEELKKGSATADEKARIYFQQALKLDPGFARAYTGMSLTYFNEWSCLLWDKWEENQQAAIDWALKAVHLDAFDPTNAAILGKTYLFFKQYDKAEHHLRNALKMNPTDPLNLAGIAFCMAFLGETEESLRLYAEAERIDPSRKGFVLTGAFVNFEAARFEKVIEIGQNISYKTGWIDFQATLAAAYYELGDQEKMWSCWNNYVEYFHEKIRPGQPVDEHFALHWMRSVNPYKKGTQHQAFWDFIQQEIGKGPLKEKLLKPKDSKFQNQISLEGNIWTLSFRGHTTQIADLKGLHDIIQLLAEPAKEFSCTDLMGVTVYERGAEVIDDQAKRTYQKRMLYLQEAIQEAEEVQHSEKLAQFRQEYDTLIDHLSQSIGKNGRSRTTGSSLEKARTAVTWRIRNAIKKIKIVHPQLAQHLKTSIKTGITCKYEPEHEMNWFV